MGGGGGAAFDKKIASQCSIQFSKYIWHLGSTFTNLITLGIGNPFQKTKSPTHPMPGWLVGLWVIPYSSNKKPWAYTVNFIYIYIRWGLCASQFQPWASPPRHLKKKIKCPALRASFVGKCLAPHSFCGGQMPGPPVHLINIQNY